MNTLTDLTFVFNIEPYTLTDSNDEASLQKDSQKMSIMLCESIKALHPLAKIVAISSNGNRPDASTLEAYTALGVEYDTTVLNRKPFNGYFNKVYAYQYMSTKITTDYVCFIDVDMLLLKPLNFEALKIKLSKCDMISALGYEPRPVLIEGEELGPMYKRFFLTEEQEKYMGKTYGVTRDNLYHSGTMFFKNNKKLKDLMVEWVKHTDIMTADPNILKHYTQGIFVNNVFTDEDVMTVILEGKENITLQVEEFVHYHIFQSLPFVFKDLAVPTHIRTILEEHEYPYLDQL